MPHQTFYNLPDDKKHSLVKAIQNEFSRVSLDKASISNIIKEAGIPRGSFYQYFDDKADAFFYLLESYTKKLNAVYMELLQKNDGEIFHTAIDFFSYMMKEKKHNSFYRNLFLNMTSEVEHAFSKVLQANKDSDYLSGIHSLVDKSKLNIVEDSQFYHVMEIIIAITFRNFVQNFAKDWTKEQAIDNFTVQINLLKDGLANRE